jgi:HAD superfamily phosphoserine phosphatase-like hydrolase
MLRDGTPRAEVNQAYYKLLLAGRSSIEVAAIAQHWFQRHAADPQFFCGNVSSFLSRALGLGARIVLVSGSFSELLRPIAEHTGAVDVLASPLEQLNGRYTGRLLGVPLIGEGKAAAVERYAAMHGLALERCAGIGDDLTDVPFLSLLGQAWVPARSDAAMLQHARDVGWSVLS